MLIENTLNGERDKVQIAINRLQIYETLALDYSNKGFYVADSGGKDSTVIKKLAELAKVKYEIAHNHTTIDYPETVYFVRKERKRAIENGIEYNIEYPVDKNGKRISFWGLLEKHGLPSRTRRWCCSIFKEGGGDGKVVVTGVRWSESSNRKKQRGIAEVQRKKRSESLILTNDNEENRMLIENCVKRGKRIVNPIIDWTDEDVWEFIRLYKLPYNSLYDMGYDRVGCVGCPMTRNFEVLERNPKYKNMYLKGIERCLKRREERGLENVGTWKTVDSFYLWWTEQVKNDNQIDGQMQIEKEKQ